MTSKIDINNFLTFFMMFHDSTTNYFKIPYPEEPSIKTDIPKLSKYIICEKISKNIIRYKIEN